MDKLTLSTWKHALQVAESKVTDFSSHIMLFEVLRYAVKWVQNKDNCDFAQNHEAYQIYLSLAGGGWTDEQLSTTVQDYITAIA